jgi:hypothetical protein
MRQRTIGNILLGSLCGFAALLTFTALSGTPNACGAELKLTDKNRIVQGYVEAQAHGPAVIRDKYHRITGYIERRPDGRVLITTKDRLPAGGFDAPAAVSPLDAVSPQVNTLNAVGR